MTPLKEKQEIPPEKELTRNSDHWFVYSEKDTGLRLICLEDLNTGAVVTTMISNPTRRTAAHKAWAGARQSRAPGMPWEILIEMGDKGVNPDEKLEEMFRNYGHASVGDMARVNVDMGRIPMHLCFSLFLEGSINSGQEKSTRYQSKFGSAVLHKIKNYLPESLPAEKIEELEKEYQTFGDLSLKLFAKHKEILLKEFEKYYKADFNIPGQKSALTSRVLDCVRFFLLWGQWSGMSFETSARDWSRIISELKASPIVYYQKLAGQIEKLLSPSSEIEEKLNFKAEAPSLISHTQANPTINNNLAFLKKFIITKTDLLQKVPISRSFPEKRKQKVSIIDPKFTPAEKMLAQYLLTLWPGLKSDDLFNWIHSLTIKTKKQISKIIFAKHTNHNELSYFARTTGITLIQQSFLGETRDHARHRAWGRFSPIPSVFGMPWTKDTLDQILASGFGLPLYLSEIKEFKELAHSFEADLTMYYKKLAKFIEKIYQEFGDNIDYSFAINLIPLAHQVDLYLNGDPKQALYFTMQRARPGGHINYRQLAYQVNQLISESDPLLSSIKFTAEPDPKSAIEFFDRS